MNARTFLVHGLVAGLVAGLLAFVVALAVGEPAIDDAIAVEESAAARAEAAHLSAEEPTEPGAAQGTGVTRGQQAGPGLLTATVLFGVVLGGVVGIGAAVATGRVGRLGAPGAAALVALIGFLAVVLAPWLKYPPNPPAVGRPDTLDQRTALYFTFVGLSVLAAIAAVALASRLVERHGGWVATVTGVAAWLLVVVVAGVSLAPIDEVQTGFPADTLFSFRVGSLLTQAALWAGIGLVLSGLLERGRRQQVAADRRRAAATAL